MAFLIASPVGFGGCAPAHGHGSDSQRMGCALSGTGQDVSRAADPCPSPGAGTTVGAADHQVGWSSPCSSG